MRVHEIGRVVIQIGKGLIGAHEIETTFEKLRSIELRQVPPVIVFSSACAGLAGLANFTGGAVPTFAQLASSSYHTVISSSSLHPSSIKDDNMSRSKIPQLCKTHNQKVKQRLLAHLKDKASNYQSPAAQEFAPTIFG
ncbi:hypothetical protein ACH5RR_006908 [Cinchona calisaya]|uniref:Uncharacterized protein n=1 Tax=Cinchona calisaya TaxID=153742 RepID=A0ABD3AQA5_9GENT